MSHQTNIVRLKAIANLLSQLNEDFVFVGGATVSLYGDEKLRKVGFENDIESGVICRYKIHN